MWCVFVAVELCGVCAFVRCRSALPPLFESHVVHILQDMLDTQVYTCYIRCIVISAVS